MEQYGSEIESSQEHGANERKKDETYSNRKTDLFEKNSNLKLVEII